MNVLISSKNRYINEPISSATYNLPAGFIQCKNDEYLTVQLKGFSMIKSFFAVMDGINNQFVIERSSIDEELIENVTTYELKIDEGYFNVNSLLTNLNLHAPQDVKFSFNAARNSLSINNLHPEDSFKFISINCGILLGCDDNVEYEITPSGIELPSYINLSGFNNMFIEITGDVILDNSSTNNIIHKDFKQSQILGMVNLVDIPYYSLIDVSNCSEFRIANRVINNIKVRLVNDNGIEFKRLSDYTLSLEFKKHENVDKYAVLKGINRLEAYLSRIFVIASRFLLEQ